MHILSQEYRGMSTNARGIIRTDLLRHSNRLKTATVLSISDYHGQIVPLSETADNLHGDA
jgi:hypothetical protein